MPAATLTPPDLDREDEPIERLAIYLAFEHTEPADRHEWRWQGCERPYREAFRRKAARYLDVAHDRRRTT